MKAPMTLAYTLLLAGLANGLGPEDTQAQILRRAGAGWQQTTGIGGTQQRTFLAPAGMVLQAIEYGEEDDVPCFIRFQWRGLSASGAVTGEDAKFDAVGCAERSERTVFVSFGPTIPRALRLIRICSRKANDRLKGLRVRGANITTTGAQRDNGLISEHTRPNCNGNWSPRVSQCPNGQAITGVRVESNEAAFGLRKVVGLSVRCNVVRLIG